MEDYDICITAVPHDSDTARMLSDSLRRYKLPGGVTVEPGTDYRRITLDVSGSPLDDKARAILDESRFLVVLCSPEVRSHRGIMERLDYFRSRQGGEHIIAVLVEGEPAEAFPENFSEKKLVRHIMPDMSVVERVENIEPIAADLRGDSSARVRTALRYETVRITASVLGLHPDALEQRHRARRRRAVMAALTLAAAVSLTAAGIFLRLGFIAKKEGDIAREQTRLSAQIAARTMEELPALFAGDEQALAYVDEAITSARSSLEELDLGDLLSGETEDGA